MLDVLAVITSTLALLAGVAGAIIAAKQVASARRQETSARALSDQLAAVDFTFSHIDIHAVDETQREILRSLSKSLALETRSTSSLASISPELLDELAVILAVPEREGRSVHEAAP